jgi:hypothetical protein
VLTFNRLANVVACNAIYSLLPSSLYYLYIVIFYNWYIGWWSSIGPLDTAATNRPIVPASGDYDDEELGGIIGRGNRSTRRKPTPAPLCPPQTLHAAPTRTRAAAVGSQRLTACVTARPSHISYAVSLRLRPQTSNVSLEELANGTYDGLAGGGKRCII